MIRSIVALLRSAQRLSRLECRLAALEAAETTREVTHASQIDQMNRFLKRFTQRLKTDQPSPPESESSPSTDLEIDPVALLIQQSRQPRR